MTNARSPDLDSIFALLADPRRRRLLYHLLETEYANAGTLSRRLAAFEAGTSVRAVDDDDSRQVGISLVHDHLPRLAAHGLVEFDARSGDVVTADGFEDVRPFVERARLAETHDELPETSRLTVLYSEPPEERFLTDDA